MWARNVLEVFGQVPVAVSYSEPHYRAIIESYGFIAVYAANNPLGQKANVSVQALRGLCDYVITTGSDDVFSSNMPEIYRANMQYDYFGFKDCYFHNLPTNETRYWPGYTCARKGEPIGAGKMVSAKLLDRMNWRPFNRKISASLDYFYTIKAKALTDNWKFVNLIDHNAYIVDLKSEHNITKWSVIKGVTQPIQSQWELIPI
jgi:hypothetical protein